MHCNPRPIGVSYPLQWSRLSGGLIILMLIGFFIIFGCVAPPKPYHSQKRVEAEKRSRQTPAPDDLSGEEGERAAIHAKTQSNGQANNRAPARRKEISRQRHYALQRDRCYERFLASISAFLDARYESGGSDPAGVDCSGFVKAIFEEVYNVGLPHNAAQIYRLGQAVEENNLQTADLVFFRRVSRSGDSINHVGIYLWERRFIHATISEGVIISSLDEDYWQRRYAGARRLEVVTEQ